MSVRVPRIPAAFALAKLALHSPFLDRYGYHRDELYFLACGEHLAAGYVDHPPLVPWLARLSRELFGDSLPGLRLWALLGGGLAVLLAGVLARRLGGGRFAQAVACLAVLIAPVYLRVGSHLVTPSLELPLWLAGAWLVTRLLQGDDPRLWLAVGALVGVGILARYSVLLFALGLLVGLAVVREKREEFCNPWLWGAMGLAALIALPNFLWQVQQGWPTLEHLRILQQGVRQRLGWGEILLGQVAYLHPVNALVWGPGLAWLLTSGRRYRVLAWLFLVPALVLLGGRAKIYYLAPAYTVLLAAGGVALEGWLRGGTRRLLVGSLAFWGLVALPAGVPVLGVEATEAYVRTLTLGLLDRADELTRGLREEVGWEERVTVVAAVYHRLSPQERSRCALLAQHFGEAAALDFYGPHYGLPPVYCPHRNYHLWGPPPQEPEVVVAAGFPRERLEELFGRVEVQAVARPPGANPLDAELEVAVCRKPRRPLQEVWPALRTFEYPYGSRLPSRSS